MILPYKQRIYPAVRKVVDKIREQLPPPLATPGVFGKESSVRGRLCFTASR